MLKPSTHKHAAHVPLSASPSDTYFHTIQLVFFQVWWIIALSSLLRYIMASREKEETHEPVSTEAPRSPPRKTLREMFTHALPRYTGPYEVGFMELELPAREPRAFSNIKRNHEYALKLDTVLFSVFYPCDLGPRGSKNHHRVPWLPAPKAPTCKGYAKFLNISHVPVTAYIACTSMFTKIPAYRNAKLSRTGPPGVSSQESLGEESDDGTEQTRNAPRFPVVIFSHGLGGSRTSQSAICGELASFGLVVVAIEHRDGSGARTYVNKPGTSSNDLEDDDLDRSHKPATPPNGDAESSPPPGKDEKNHEQRRSHYKVDYIFPKDNAQDTSPHNPIGVDTELRGAQIEMRLAEIEEAYYVLELINSGQADQVVARNLRKKGHIGSSSQGLEGICWSDWQGRLQMSSVTAMGHSFGGATTVQVLRHAERFTWVSQGILLDAWGPATPQDDQNRVRKPILSIGSEAFMHWKENYDHIESICREARDEGALCWMTTIRGSTHLSQTDFAVLYPNWMSLLMKTIVNPRRAINLTIHSALEFLMVTLPSERVDEITVGWMNEELLQNADHETKVSFDHRPDDKWIAARLKIENEFSLRLSRWFQRPGRASGGIPRDASGKPLAGLLNWGPGNELWTHMSPEPADVESYMER